LREKGSVYGTTNSSLSSVMCLEKKERKKGVCLIFAGNFLIYDEVDFYEASFSHSWKECQESDASML
jgi:hypothetical protein